MDPVARGWVLWDDHVHHLRACSDGFAVDADDVRPVRMVQLLSRPIWGFGELAGTLFEIENLRFQAFNFLSFVARSQSDRAVR